jgi:uncharacterized membrane protein
MEWYFSNVPHRGRRDAENVHTGQWQFLPLGVLQEGMYYPRDYFPLFPWTGVMQFGVAAGSVLYPAGKCRFLIPDAGTIGRSLAFVGRHLLDIYLLHIPIIATALCVVMVVSQVIGMPFGYL